MSFNAKRYNAKAFTEGTWAEIMGGRFKIARIGNSDYQMALEKSGFNSDRTPAKDKTTALYTAAAKGLLKDWEDVTDADGNQIKYSIEAAVAVMIENPDLFEEIVEFSKDLDNYRAQDIEAQAKKR